MSDPPPLSLKDVLVAYDEHVAALASKFSQSLDMLEEALRVTREERQEMTTAHEQAKTRIKELEEENAQLRSQVTEVQNAIQSSVQAIANGQAAVRRLFQEMSERWNIEDATTE